jgi:hypothetical protein
MGDEILMKKLIILPILAIYLQANDSRLAMVSEYKTMFSKIGEKRVGVDVRKIDALSSPFVKVKKPKTVKTVDGEVIEEVVTPEFVLQAIVNKKVKISGKWYKLGDEVGDLKISSIRKGVVWLKSSDYKKRLTMRKENAKFSIK